MQRARRSARGRILLVQEQRFRLRTDDGNSYLLTLAHDANAGIEDLRRFMQARIPVTVEYGGEPGLASAAAYKVSPAPSDADEPGGAERRGRNGQRT
jgi:hypothetical protein